MPPSINPIPKTTEQEIIETCNEMRDLLVQKNQAYGDSALNPIRLFSKADPVEAIRVRIDDKLSRLARGNEKNFGEDPEWDLVGYLILLRVAKKRQRALSAESPRGHSITQG